MFWAVLVCPKADDGKCFQIPLLSPNVAFETMALLWFGFIWFQFPLQYFVKNFQFDIPRRSKNWCIYLDLPPKTTQFCR